MNFENLQKAWQAQDAGATVTINADQLLKQVRQHQRQFQTMILWRDAREVGVAIFLAWLFLYWGLREDDWSLDLVAFSCFFVGSFILVDRLVQHQRRPVMSHPLRSCVQSSLNRVNHQIWLLKNIVWWYLLPTAGALGISFVRSSWHAGYQGWRTWFGLGLATLICALVYWGVYWLNLFAVRKQLEPRRQELETLLTETINPALAAETQK